MNNISNSFVELSYEDKITLDGGNLLGAFVLGVGVVTSVALLIATAPVSVPLAAASTLSTAVWVASGAGIGVGIVGVIDAIC